MTKAWVVSVDMGYGHQRAAYPLKDIANERIITANSDKMISLEEKSIWENTRKFYEFISRLKKIPFVGKRLFELYDKVQYISPFYPFRDLSKPDLNTLVLKRQIMKQGLCRSLIQYVKSKDLPFIATHPIPAIAAHHLGLKNIFCVCTDTDIARAWIPDEPEKNTITYLAPCLHVAVRLREYGIAENKIILTGFPLPKENIGPDNTILKRDLSQRLVNLDPNRKFIKAYEEVLKKRLGVIHHKSDHMLTLTFAIGGAGAQSETGIKIIKSLKEKLVGNEIRLNVVAGTRLDVLSFYQKELAKFGLSDHVNVVFALDKKSYFEQFNKVLRTTDILWTKPSELSFYTALGLPIIIAPPIGAHENYNSKWLRDMGSGFVEEDPAYTSDWLNYWLQDGRLAQAAWQGWQEAPSLGTYNIEKILKRAEFQK